MLMTSLSAITNKKIPLSVLLEQEKIKKKATKLKQNLPETFSFRLIILKRQATNIQGITIFQISKAAINHGSKIVVKR